MVTVSRSRGSPSVSCRDWGRAGAEGLHRVHSPRSPLGFRHHFPPFYTVSRSDHSRLGWFSWLLLGSGVRSSPRAGCRGLVASPQRPARAAGRGNRAYHHSDHKAGGAGHRSNGRGSPAMPCKDKRSQPHARRNRSAVAAIRSSEGLGRGRRGRGVRGGMIRRGQGTDQSLGP